MLNIIYNQNYARDKRQQEYREETGPVQTGTWAAAESQQTGQTETKADLTNTRNPAPHSQERPAEMAAAL